MRRSIEDKPLAAPNRAGLRRDHFVGGAG